MPVNWDFIASTSASGNDLWQHLRGVQGATWMCVWPYKRPDIWLSLLEPWQVCGSASETAWWCKKNIKVGQPWISIITWESFFYELLCCSPLCVVPLVWTHHRGDVVGTSQSTTKMAIATTLQNSEYFPIYFYFLNRKKIWYIIHKHIFKVQNCKKIQIYLTWWE